MRNTVLCLCNTGRIHLLDTKSYEIKYTIEGHNRKIIKDVVKCNINKILVKYQIVGNYMFYMEFKKKLANMKKIINFENEEIKTILKKKGEITADGIISLARLPS